MNKVIEELMLQAGYAAPELAGRGQKLAELIVEECAGVADATSVSGPPRGCTYGNMILEHFGIGS